MSVELNDVRGVTDTELTAIAGGAWHVDFFGAFSMGTTDQGNFYFCQDKGDYVGCYNTYPKTS